MGPDRRRLTERKKTRCEILGKENNPRALFSLTAGFVGAVATLRTQLSACQLAWRQVFGEGHYIRYSCTFYEWSKSVASKFGLHRLNDVDSLIHCQLQIKCLFVRLLHCNPYHGFAVFAAFENFDLITIRLAVSTQATPRTHHNFVGQLPIFCCIETTFKLVCKLYHCKGMHSGAVNLRTFTVRQSRIHFPRLLLISWYPLNHF